VLNGFMRHRDDRVGPAGAGSLLVAWRRMPRGRSGLRLRWCGRIRRMAIRPIRKCWCCPAARCGHGRRHGRSVSLHLISAPSRRSFGVQDSGEAARRPSYGDLVGRGGFTPLAAAGHIYARIAISIVRSRSRFSRRARAAMPLRRDLPSGGPAGTAGRSRFCDRFARSTAWR